MTFKCNTTWHRASNMTPIQVFRVRRVINLLEPVVYIEEVDDEEEERDFVGNLDDVVEVSEESTENATIEQFGSTDEPIKLVDEEYRTKYITRMQ